MALTSICKTFDFDAAHRLPALPSDHKCHRLHGHTYRVDVVLVGRPDRHGMMIDYAEIARLVQPVIDELDHRYLNEIPGLEHPTTEVVAAWFAARLARMDCNELCAFDRVRVYESATTWAEVRLADLDPSLG